MTETDPAVVGDAPAAGPAAPPAVEFLRRPYPFGEPDGRAAWGIRIDGTDLRALVAEATRDGWTREWDRDDEPGDPPEDREHRLLHQHAALVMDDDEQARRHFLGDPDPERREPGGAAMALLGCVCGVDECWPLMATVTVTPRTVTWSAFHQPYRPEWGTLAVGPYAFPRPAYEQALATPVRVTDFDFDSDAEPEPEPDAE